VGKLRAHVDEVIQWVAGSLVYTSIALHESASGRSCCKSPKLPGANFSAVEKSDRRPPFDVALNHVTEVASAFIFRR
jgi:hypothetical protein